MGAWADDVRDKLAAREGSYHRSRYVPRVMLPGDAVRVLPACPTVDPDSLAVERLPRRVAKEVPTWRS